MEKEKLKEILRALNSMKLKDTKRACIVRGIDFFYLLELDAMGMQDWLVHHWDDPIAKSRVKTYDDWSVENAELFGGILPGEFPDALKLAQVRTGNNFLPLSMRESPEEIIHYRPKEGTPKEKVFKWVSYGYTTKEIIASMDLAHPDISPGSVKVWASKARKQIKAKNEAANNDTAV